MTKNMNKNGIKGLFLVLDTESSIDLTHSRARILVSLAYEVVDSAGRILASFFAVVKRPADLKVVRASE